MKVQRSLDSLKAKLNSEYVVYLKENSEFRKKLREIGEKLDAALQKKSEKKPEKTKRPEIPEKKTENIQKLLIYFKKEKKHYETRIKQLSDINYQLELEKNIQNLEEKLKQLQKINKTSETLKKKSVYSSTSSLSHYESASEASSLNKKKYSLIKAINLLENSLTLTQKSLQDTDSKLKTLEKELSSLNPQSATSLVQEKKKTVLQKDLSTKSRAKIVSEKSNFSRMNALTSKIKDLETELRFLKEDENVISKRINQKNVAVDEMSRLICNSPSYDLLTSGFKIRSASVKPNHFKKVDVKVDLSAKAVDNISGKIDFR